MNYWLLKTEPETFSYATLESLGSDRWNGVRNFRALKFMRAMEPGDRAFIYHTGKEKQIIGVAQIISSAYPDPEAQDSRFVVVEVKPLYKLNRSVTLREIKTKVLFTDWDLVNQPRLSVMPVTPAHWQEIHRLSDTPYLKRGENKLSNS